MVRLSKDAKIKELEKRLAETEGYLEAESKRNHIMSEQAEKGFLNSPTYNQMRQELEFFKSLCKLNDIQLAKAKKKDLIDREQLQQIYADNKRMCEHEGNTEYWIGITENMHGAKEYENLRDKIRELKGRVGQQEQAIANRDDEIYRLQLLIGEMMCQVDTALSDCEIQTELKEKNGYVENLQKAVVDLENVRIQVLEENKNLRKENQELRECINKTSEENLEYHKRICRLEEELSCKKSECNKVENEIETERMKKLEKLIRELEGQVSDLAIATLPTNEVTVIIEHNIEQMKNIKKTGKPGRPPKVDSQKIDTVLELKAKGHSIRSIAEQLNISVGSVHRYIKMNEENE